VAALESLYRDLLLDHAKHPQGEGLADEFDGESHQVNPTCGDEVTVRVRLDDAGHLEVTHAGHGCSISRAAASVMVEAVEGGDADEAVRRYAAFHALVTGAPAHDDAEELLGDGVAFAGVAQYPMRVKCALLPWMALRDALAHVPDPPAAPADPTGASS
jgi:nitrogen fixation NifU-like protein